ncbi:MAG TPA: chemotaxis protein CheW, partial [Bdellovibrionales bacterium]|nr:chemotaxis protein CheW [Bdellovibrionales bacterium]
IGGTIDIFTQKGRGTTFKIKLPLTLAIISALIVRAGGEGSQEVFAIPQSGVVELVRVSEANKELIESIHGASVFRLRDKLLPLVPLGCLLALGTKERAEESSFSIVVIKVGEMQFGLVVDEIFDMQEIVVKPVGRLLRDADLYAGTTILGNGQVILILDSARVAAQAFSQSSDLQGSLEAKNDSRAVEADRTTLLLFRTGGGNKAVVPLPLVARLEEFAPAAIEHVDRQLLVQYRGALLPLIKADPGLDLSAARASSVPAIIFSDGKRAMGLLVEEILDIVDENLQIQTQGQSPGVLGVAIAAGHACGVIDTYHFIRQAYPDWFKVKPAAQSRPGARILLVEDSPFFRHLLQPILESKGYALSIAEDGAQAYEYLQSNPVPDLILSDIEMPVMNGFELAEKVREHPALKNVPMVALTSLDTPADRMRAKRSGFDDFLVKFNRDALAAVLQKHLHSTTEVEAQAA